MLGEEKKRKRNLVEYTSVLALVVKFCTAGPMMLQRSCPTSVRANKGFVIGPTHPIIHDVQPDTMFPRRCTKPGSSDAAR